MAYDQIGGQRYAIESVEGNPSSSSLLLIVGGLLVAAGGALFAIGPAQYMDERDFMVTLAFIFGGGAAMLGGFMLGLHHGARPTVIAQPGELAIDEPGAEDRRLHVDGRSFRIDDVQRVELQSMRLVYHDVESSSTTERVVYFVAIVLPRNVVELSFREGDEAGRHASELAKRLGKSGPEVRVRAAPIGTGLLGALVIVGGIVGLFAATIFGLWFAEDLEPLDIVRVAAYVAAITPATYVLARAARAVTLRGWLRGVYGFASR